jgi:hypothetical protein
MQMKFVTRLGIMAVVFFSSTIALAILFQTSKSPDATPVETTVAPTESEPQPAEPATYQSFDSFSELAKQTDTWVLGTVGKALSIVEMRSIPEVPEEVTYIVVQDLTVETSFRGASARGEVIFVTSLDPKVYGQSPLLPGQRVLLAVNKQQSSDLPGFNIQTPTGEFYSRVGFEASVMDVTGGDIIVPREKSLRLTPNEQKISGLAVELPKYDVQGPLR